MKTEQRKASHGGSTSPVPGSARPLRTAVLRQPGRRPGSSGRGTDAAHRRRPHDEGRSAGLPTGSADSRPFGRNVPLTPVQQRVLAVIAAGRSPESYLAGGAVLNRDRPRLSDDRDIFHNEEHRVFAQAESDVATLAGAGFRLRPVLREFGLVEYDVETEEGRTIVQWMGDTDLRFFPILQDEIFGWRLSDADLA